MRSTATRKATDAATMIIWTTRNDTLAPGGTRRWRWARAFVPVPRGRGASAVLAVRGQRRIAASPP